MLASMSAKSSATRTRVNGLHVIGIVLVIASLIPAFSGNPVAALPLVIGVVLIVGGAIVAAIRDTRGVRSDEPAGEGVDETQPRTTWQTYRWTVIVLLGAVVVAVGIWAVSAAVEAREADQRSDEYYCTMEGISPLDRAPATGERCVDLG